MKLQLDYGEPTFTLTSDGRLELVHDWEIMYRGEAYAVPAGFVTDGASIPAWIRWLCGSPWEAPRLYAALVHDFLYSGGDPEERKSWTRAEARQAVKSLVMALDGWKADGEKGIGL